MTRTALPALALLGLASAGLIAGCGTHSADTASGSTATTGTGTGSSATPTVTVTESSAPVSSPSPAPTASPTTTGASGPADCTTANLTLSLGTGNGAAGSDYYPLHFLNKGTTTCRITGYPGVSWVAGSAGTQVGPAASRNPSTPDLTLTLTPGTEATATLQVTDYLNYPATTCKATSVEGFRVYPPNQKAAAFIATPGGTKTCSGAATLSVSTVVAGAGQQ